MKITTRLLLVLSICNIVGACSDPYAPQMDEAAIEKNEKALEALDNQCEQDSDCMVTGCHRSVCRAAPEASFCDHTLAFTRLDSDPDTDRLRADMEVILRAQLQQSEVHTLQISVSADRVTAWFHTSYSRREQIEQRLSAIRTGGLYRWSALSPVVAQAVMDRVGSEGRIRLRAAEGGPALLETTIEGNDIAAARSVLRAAVTDNTPPNTRWAFELLPQTFPPVMRAWLLDPRPLLDLNRLSELTQRQDPSADTTLISGRFDDIGQKILADATPPLVGHTLLWVADDEVLASSKLTKPLRDGRFELAFSSLNAYTHAQTAKAVLEQMERMRAAPNISSRVAFNPEITRSLEAHLPCYQHQPPLATCGCSSEGRCAWRDDDPLKACIDQSREPPPP